MFLSCNLFEYAPCAWESSGSLIDVSKMNKSGLNVLKFFDACFKYCDPDENMNVVYLSR